MLKRGHPLARNVRELIVSEAPLARVAAIAKEVVEEEGGVVRRHTHVATTFDHLRTAEDNWSRSGYLGTYQPYQSKSVRLRVRCWASWPRRLLRGFIWFGAAQAVIFLLMSVVGAPPAANVWVSFAILTFTGIAIALLTYATSFAGSADVEDALIGRLRAELQADELVPGDVYTKGGWKERREELIEAAVDQAPEAAAEEASERQGRLALLRRKGKEGEAAEAASDETPASQEGKRKRRIAIRRKPKEDPGEADEPPSDEAAPGDAKRKRRIAIRRKPKEEPGETDEQAAEGAEGETEEPAKKRRRLVPRRKRKANEEDEAAQGDDEPPDPEADDRSEEE